MRIFVSGIRPVGLRRNRSRGTCRANRSNACVGISDIALRLRVPPTIIGQKKQASAARTTHTERNRRCGHPLRCAATRDRAQCERHQAGRLVELYRRCANPVHLQARICLRLSAPTLPEVRVEDEPVLRYCDSITCKQIVHKCVKAARRSVLCMARGILYRSSALIDKVDICQSDVARLAGCLCAALRLHTAMTRLFRR
jgi:hypothetical protein